MSSKNLVTALLFCLLASTRSVCAQTPTPAGTPSETFRDPFTVKFQFDDKHKVERRFDKTPYVSEKTVHVFPGEEFGINVRREGESAGSQEGRLGIQVRGSEARQAIHNDADDPEPFGQNAHYGGLDAASRIQRAGQNQPGSSFASFDGNGNMATADSEAGAEDSAIGCRSEGSRWYSAISMSPLWPAGQAHKTHKDFPLH